MRAFSLCLDQFVTDGFLTGAIRTAIVRLIIECSSAFLFPTFTLFIFSYCMSDGSLGSLHRWRSQRIAKCWSCELQDTLAHFGLRNTLLTERSSRFADYALSFLKVCSALGWVWLFVFTLQCFVLIEALKCLHIFSQLSLSSSYFLPWTAKHLLKWFFVWALPFIFWMKGLARTYNHLVTIVISARMYLSCLHSSLLTTVTHCLQQCTIAFFLFLFL